MKTNSKVALIIASSAALVGGIFLGKKIADDNANSPEKILDRIKADLSSIGTIGSSWISSNITKNDDGPSTYTGVVEITEGDKKYQLEFQADTTNGEVISMEKIKA